MTRKTTLASFMVLTILVATISASSIAYAAQDPKPKDTAKSFFDIFTELGYTVDSFFDIFTELQTDVDNLETQVEQLQTQIGDGDGSTRAVDMFMKIDGIPGESTDDKHRGEIDIESWSWGASQSGTSTGGGGGGAGKVSFKDLTFVHKIDKASPKLFLATAKGEHIRDAELTVRKAGDKPLEYYKIKMSDVLISSIDQGSSSDSIPTEEISLNFAKVEIEYVPQDPATGEPQASVTASWDQKTNTES